jgi:hypothetical protein
MKSIYHLNFRLNILTARILNIYGYQVRVPSTAAEMDAFLQSLCEEVK